MKARYHFCLGLMCLVAISCYSYLQENSLAKESLEVKPTSQKQAEPDIAISKNAMVVSVSEPASEVGLQILKQGGNAVDAAVATAFALAVTYPPAGNIGGGGFMMIHPDSTADKGNSKNEPVCIDYREVAPATAKVNMFAPGESNLGAKAVGVPGTVKGLALAHQRFWQNCPGKI